MRVRCSVCQKPLMLSYTCPAGSAGAWQAMQRTVAARLALLGCMLAAALAAHSAVVYGPQGGVEELRWGLVQVWLYVPLWERVQCATVL